tara:strand:- start:128 stop:733 length:606 start_codon:yes stop_codon:yes gene_type:complete
MYVSKDIYEYITNFTDDKTILNMLSVNKKFNTEEFFGRVLFRKYPLLIRFKLEDETSKSLFLRMSYYLAKLDEQGIPYIPLDDYNPNIFYKRYSTDRDIYDLAMAYASMCGNMDIIKLMIDKGATNFNLSLIYAAEEGYINIVEFAIDMGATNFNSGMIHAIMGGHIDMAKLMYGRGANNFQECMQYTKDPDVLTFLKLMS